MPELFNCSDGVLDEETSSFNLAHYGLDVFHFYRGHVPGWVCRDAQTVDLDFRSTDRRGMDGRDPVRKS